MNNWTQSDSAGSFGEEELRLIPAWSIALALALFIGVQYVIYNGPHGSHPSGEARHGYLAMHIMMGYAWGALLASYALMLGYISRDVKRRGMSAGLWMLVCVILPGGIGTVVYFMLRQPILQSCPNCRSSISASFHFCPQCQFQTAPVCETCHQSVRITDAFCTCCGHALSGDNTPARLRVYSD